MSWLTVAPEVCVAFPGLRIDAVVAEEFAGSEPWPQVAGQLAALEASAAAGRLPRINPAVDCCNLISASYGVPAGAFDLQQVIGDIMVEMPRPGEVIRTDALGVLTPHWDRSGAGRTRVTEASRHILFLLETTDAEAFGPGLSAASAALLTQLAARSPRVSSFKLTPDSPTVALPGTDADLTGDSPPAR